MIITVMYLYLQNISKEPYVYVIFANSQCNNTWLILSSPKHIHNHIDRCREDIIANNVPHTRTYLSYWEGKTFIWFWQTLSKRYRMTCSCHHKIMVAIYITMSLFPFFYLEIYCKEKYLAQWYEEIVSFEIDHL